MAVVQRYFVGLDLGQAGDWTALAVLGRTQVNPRDPPSRCRPSYALRHLHRFPLGTGYPEIVQAVRNLLRTPPLPGAVLGVDRTGVGSAVLAVLVDGLQNQVTCGFCPVVLTDGHEVTLGENGAWYVPKKELVSALQVLFQTRRLQVPRTLPNAATLVKELESFRAKVSISRQATLESWREGAHDDLLFAVALAAWLGEMALRLGADQPEECPTRTILVPL